MKDIITNYTTKIKICSKILAKPEFIISLTIFAVSISSFILGRHSAGDLYKINEIKFYQVPENPIKNLTDNRVAAESTENKDNVIFGSKNGTKYYFSWCSGASRVKLENRVYYKTEESAKTAGRTIAAGCNQ